MDNNNFENGFYGAEPQKPFTDKSNSYAENAQEQNNLPNEGQTPDFQPRTPDFNETPRTDYSHPVYSNGSQYGRTVTPQQGDFGGYYPPKIPVFPNNPNMQGRNEAYPPYTAKPPKKKMSAGLIVIIVVICALLVAGMAGLCVYVVSQSWEKDTGENFDFTLPNYSYTTPVGGADSPKAEHNESDYSDRANVNFKGLDLKAKPKDYSDGKKYTAKYAFDRISDSVAGIVCYSDKITNVENSASQGSGIIISSDGYVVTNAHVIGNSKTQYVLQVVTSEGKAYSAGVVGYDSRTDIAVLKMDGAKNLTAAEFGNSEKTELGEDIIAVGNPGGLDYQNSITKGIVSALDRKMSTTSLVKYIQTDAAINPGNSGGPIVNMYGQVIGIATSKIVSEKYEGMGFAIPTSSAKEIIDTLMRKGYVEGRVKIGITGRNIDSAAASAYNLPKGILIDEISEDGPCYGKGLNAGDIIIGADGKVITSFSDIYEILEKHKPNDKIILEYYKSSDGSQNKVEITLTEDK